MTVEETVAALLREDTKAVLRALAAAGWRAYRPKPAEVQRKCVQCSAPVVNRRADALYCSDKCRDRVHYARRVADPEVAEKQRQRHREWRKANPERRYASHRKWVEANRDKDRNRHRRKYWGNQQLADTARLVRLLKEEIRSVQQ